MKSVILDPSFAAWRTEARNLLMEGVRPEDVFWRETDASATVFGSIDPPAPGSVDPNAKKPVKIAREFLAMLKRRRAIARRTAGRFSTGRCGAGRRATARSRRRKTRKACGCIA